MKCTVLLCAAERGILLPYGTTVRNSSTVLHIYIPYIYSILYTYSTRYTEFQYMYLMRILPFCTDPHTRSRSLHFSDRMWGEDELCTPPTHTPLESQFSQLSGDVWVDMVLTSSVPSNSRQKARATVIPPISARCLNTLTTPIYSCLNPVQSTGLGY